MTSEQTPPETNLKNGPLMDAKQLRAALRYVFSGRLVLPGGHLPQTHHKVPEDFIGVGVTTSADPEVDSSVLDYLADLQLKNVRIDFTYGDEAGPVGRLLSRLLQTNLQVLLHLVQPFIEAQQMKTPAAQQRWHAFVTFVVEHYGEQVAAIEVGSTSNRRRWAGYDTESFFATWRIAHDIIKFRNIRLAGPNISDFEPLHNIAVLARLKREFRLPDIHTNNLFCERVTEPERFDHRIFGTQLATLLKVNLVKKARLLKKITSDFGVSEFISPAAFWTLPRIRRILVQGEQKQADYLSRYFVLLAASGALNQVYWGPLICHREGLVDDGFELYPQLERITHYQSVLGQKMDFRLRPAFQALRAFNQLIPGSLYEGALATTEAVEVHAFRTQTQLIHVLWTANGQAMALSDLYAANDIQSAMALERDGNALTEMPEFITESPLYLCWPVDSKVQLIPSFNARKRVSLYRHMPGKQPYQFDQDGWHGILLADNAQHAAELRQCLHPDFLPAATADNTLRKARNLIWRADQLMERALALKKPLKMHPHKRLLDRFKPSKAKRSWNAAGELLRRGIPTALPVAFFEKKHDATLLNNLYLCEIVDHDFSARDMLSAFKEGTTDYWGISPQDAYEQLAEFLNEMHSRGVFFRDLAGGNILIKKQPDQRLSFTLIDINRARFFNRHATLSERLSDLTRICNKLHWDGREKLVGHYLKQGKYHRAFNWRCRLPFYLYDFKVTFKRRYGRKAITRLMRSIFKRT